MNIDELVNALREVVSIDDESGGWFTRHEFQESSKMTEKRAIKLLRAGVTSGMIEVGRVYRRNIAGVSTKVIAYRKSESNDG